jgi:hypothetical protein
MPPLSRRATRAAVHHFFIKTNQKEIATPAWSSRHPRVRSSLCPQGPLQGHHKYSPDPSWQAVTEVEVEVEPP